MNTELRGTSLREADIREGRALVTEWHPKALYKFDAGIAVGQFLDGLKEGKLLGRKCNASGRVVIPPRMFCEISFQRSDEWVQLANTGTVNTFSVSFVNWDASRRETPQVPAVVDIDGTNPNMGILHLLGEVGETLDEVLQRVKVGMAVEAVWKPAEQREGAITDILYFRPVGGG